MTEQEWMECAEPWKMIELVIKTAPASDRQLRLYACGCFRGIWDSLSEPEKQVLRIGEWYADGASTKQEILEAVKISGIFTTNRKAVGVTVYENIADGLVPVISHEFWISPVEQKRSCILLRDIFGNCFGHITINRTWLTWNDGTVCRIAHAIYDERAFDRIPILADALEDAGCDNAEILNHCRSDSPHVRGCWVVDLLLGKD
jgi:hypothetical protein